MADATGENGPLQKGTVTFANNGGLSIEAVIINPSGFESVPMPVGSPITCALGREFRVTAKGDTRWFKTWYAPDTLIAGSPATSETFILGNSSQQVGPGKRSESTVTIGDNVDWTGVGPLADEIWTSQDGLGRTVLHVAEGTYVGVSLAESAPEPDPCPLDLASSWKLSVDGEMSYRTSLTVRGGDVQLAQECGKTPTWTHALSGDGGVLPFGLQENPSGDIQGYIIGAVTDHGPWPDSQTFNQDFVTEFQVQPGFQLETISLPGEGTQCADDIPSLFVQGGVTAHATLATGPGGTSASTQRKSKLDVKVEVAGGCSKSPAEAAHISGSNLKKNYTRVTTCHTDTELITLTAVPHCGFYLKRWTGNAVLCDSNGNPRTDKSLTAPETQPSQWVTDATIYVKCPKDASLTAIVQMPPFAIIVPDNNPATIDNHFMLPGSIAVTCNDPCPDNVEWEISGLDWAEPDHITKATYEGTVLWSVTALPESNSGFGKKTVTATRKCGCGSDTREVEVFFSGADTACNHPDSGDCCAGFPGPSPNWYNYWKQTSADYGTHCFSANLNTGVVWGFPGWFIAIDQGANDPYPLAYPEGPTNGIDTYAWCVRHEAAHMADFPTWWPNGPPDPNLPPIDPPDPTQPRDRDDDWLPDHVEDALGWDYTDPHSQDPRYYDADWYAMTIRRIPWTLGSADAEDWSHNGKQSNQ